MSGRLKLQTQPIIRAMTRVPTIGGITYPLWGMMLLISVSAIVVFKSLIGFFVLLATLYLVGRILSRYDVFFMNIIITQLSECPGTRNQGFWGCQSYEPW